MMTMTPGKSGLKNNWLQVKLAQELKESIQLDCLFAKVIVLRGLFVFDLEFSGAN